MIPRDLPYIKTVVSHLQRFHGHRIDHYALDLDDLVQEVICKLLEGAASLNSACQCAVIKEVRYRKRHTYLRDPNE